METIRFSKIGVDDISLGTGSFEVRLADERIAAKQQVNLRRLAPDVPDNSVLFMDTNDIGSDTAFTFNAATNLLTIPSIAGGAGSGDDVTIDSTTHATKGFVLLAPSGGNVGIGTTTPDTLLHLNASGPLTFTIENDDGGTTGDAQISFDIATSTKYSLGVDDSDGDRFKIATGAALGTNTALTIDTNQNIGIGIDIPLAALHVKTTSSGVSSIASGADEIAIESGTNAGISILTPNTGTAAINFDSPDGAAIGSITYNHSTNELALLADVAGKTRIAGQTFIGDTANTNNALGLTINQGSQSDQILSFKQSNVAHGITNVTETDTYGYVSPTSSTTGGCTYTGLSEAGDGIRIRGACTTEDTAAASTSSVAPVVLAAFLKSGADFTDLGTDAKILVVRDASNARFIVDADGDTFVDGSGTLGTYDEYDDVKLLVAAKSALARDSKTALADWIDEHLDILREHGVVTEGGFVSYKGLSGLMVDAIRQLDSRIAKLEEI